MSENGASKDVLPPRTIFQVPDEHANQALGLYIEFSRVRNATEPGVPQHMGLDWGGEDGNFLALPTSVVPEFTNFVRSKLGLGEKDPLPMLQTPSAIVENKK